LLKPRDSTPSANCCGNAFPLTIAYDSFRSCWSRASTSGHPRRIASISAPTPGAWRISGDACASPYWGCAAGWG
jgi:hypothetical protein